MKKQKLKLGLTKLNISNLSNLQKIKGGGTSYSVEYFCVESFTVGIDLCCNEPDPLHTELTGCHTSNSGNNSEFLHCTATIGTYWSQCCE